jgi:hypothetical protein
MQILEEQPLERYQEVHNLVVILKEAPEPYKSIFFNTLVQHLYPYLRKFATKVFWSDRLIDKHRPKRIKPDMPVWSEDFLVCVGFLWKVVLEYKPEIGVYFPHYMNLRFEWFAKDTWTKMNRRMKGRKNEISYEERVENSKSEMDEPRKNSRYVRVEGMSYDDNFEEITFELALSEPLEFVEDEDIYALLSSFTEKQMEAYVFELQGYYQEQIAHEIYSNHKICITQQAVNERLCGVKKKIEKLAVAKRGGMQNGQKEKEKYRVEKEKKPEKKN